MNIFKIIEVNTAAPYKVLAGRGMLTECGSLIKEFGAVNKNAVRAALITDDSVDALFGESVLESLEAAGFKTVKYVLPHGEASKNTDNYIAVLEFLAENEITRTDFLVALGGGVVGDLTGFAAATILRGIDFIQIPTTLLACVDSSVGGKTGVDLKAGKNLAGAFHQPRLVICDLDTLDTLPEDIFRDGCAEVIKYGILGDEELFRHLQENGLGFDRQYVVPRCIEMKRDIVVKDEHDLGLRQLLNLGHTLAHAAELKSNFGLSHGKAVAIGMTAISKASAAEGICSPDIAARIKETVGTFGLPVHCDYSPDELYEAMLKDKKRKGNSISVIVPESIGKCSVMKMGLTEFKAFMEKGLL